MKSSIESRRYNEARNEICQQKLMGARCGRGRWFTVNEKGCKCIGVCKADRHGRITKLQREFWGQGWIFKDWNAFQKHRDAPCYVPELSDTVYTGNDFMDLCGRQEEIAVRLFCEVDWQSPAALMHEWEINGEVCTCDQCGKMFLSYDVHQCPHCGCSITE